MSPITACFRHSALTHEPMQLSPPEICAVARNVRAQITSDPLARPLDLSRIDEQGDRFDVNDIRFGVFWDFDHDVRNEHDKEVLGVTEYHDATPLHVLVSINGPRLHAADTLLRSTIAHELGHVIFDAPSWMVNRQESVSRAASDPHPLESSNIHPMELRANEFMGALLVPPSKAGTGVFSRVPPATRCNYSSIFSTSTTLADFIVSERFGDSQIAG